MLEIAAGHCPFSDQFQHMANQNLFWLAKFAVHFQRKGNKCMAYREIWYSKGANQFWSLFYYCCYTYICDCNNMPMLFTCLLFYALLLLVNITQLWCRYYCAMLLYVAVIMCKCCTFVPVIVCDVTTSKCYQTMLLSLGINAAAMCHGLSIHFYILQFGFITAAW